MFIVSLKINPALSVISFFVSLCATLENAAKFTKLSARTYGDLVSAQLVYVNDSLITLCLTLDEICLWFSTDFRTKTLVFRRHEKCLSK